MSEANDKNPPKVFISYSHDTPEHKKWVGEFASKLVAHGVDVILDQWDLGLGDDVPKFMEKSVGEADRVLMICTETYVRKADDGKGGVGYEAMIVTGELVKNLGTAKFIPVVRQENGEANLPKCVSTRFWVNLSDGQNEEEQFDHLARDLQNAPKLKKPTIGPNPFAESAPSASPMEAVTATTPTPATGVRVPNDPTDAYAVALDLARRGDFVSWRHLIKRVKQPIPAQLSDWQKRYVNRHEMKIEDLPAMVLEAAAICAPLMSVALAGVESGQPKFSNQVALLDDLLCPKDWNGSGLSAVVEVPDALVFIYQALHGAVCMESDQLPLALQLARSRVQRRHQGESVVVYQDSKLIGWPESLAGHSKVAWKFLADLSGKWPWLLETFETTEDYQAALFAYYLALNTQELVDLIASGREAILEKAELRPDVPLTNHLLAPDIRRKGYRLLLRTPEAVRQIWRKEGIPDKKMAAHWEAWMRHCTQSLNRLDRFGFHGQVAHEKLFEDLRPEP
ncbi:MAG: TIR domain-containing protein [Proteobacteria bacterium]|nr:TIR domain-containing protein [Verrucomicrobiota bacterium]NBU10681.1 TIR domain-containing protein [Pseudomonadota bacterium]